MHQERTKILNQFLTSGHHNLYKKLLLPAKNQQRARQAEERGGIVKEALEVMNAMGHQIYKSKINPENLI